jgi:acetolactate synthase-1/3 small subunit
MTPSDPSQSVYAPAPKESSQRPHTLSLLVENRPGALAKVVGFFTARGYNIDSLSVAETDHNAHLSRITVVTQSTEAVIELIKVQLSTLIYVHSIRDLTTYGPFIAREVGLVKINLDTLPSSQKDEVKQIAVAHGAVALVTPQESTIYQIVATAGEVSDFIDAMRPFNPIDVSRSGIAAISNSDKPIGKI